MQAPWDVETCTTSIKVNGLYEAAGLALWLRTGVFRIANTPEGEKASGDVSMETLQKFVNSFFSKDSAMKASVMRGQKKSRTGRERIVWPIEMIVVTESTADLEKDGGFDASLSLVGCHFVLWAWYYALFQALHKGAPSPKIDVALDFKCFHVIGFLKRKPVRQYISLLVFFPHCLLWWLPPR